MADRKPVPHRTAKATRPRTIPLPDVAVRDQRHPNVGPRDARDLLGPRLERVRTGLPFAAVEALQKAADLNLGQIAVLLGIPERTIARRKKDGKLSTAESDRVDRTSRVIAQAAETLGGEDKARAWLQRPNRGLGGATPLSLLDTDRGTRAVEDVLSRLEHGIYG